MKRLQMNYPRNKTERGAPPALWVLVAFATVCVVAMGLLVLLITRMNWRHRSLGAVPFAAGESSSADVRGRAFVDLGAFYNAGRSTNWIGGGRVFGQDLAALPDGVIALQGVLFQVQGVVQLRGSGNRQHASCYPEKVQGIPVRVKCSRLHFLHATCWWVSDTVPIAAYCIRFADGSRSEIPVIYGRDVRDWSFDADDPNQADNAAWSSKEGWLFHRIYQSVWENPKPQMEIKEIDFVSLGTACHPFLLAITVE